MSKIYTKRGDKGTTSLLGCRDVPKTDVRVEANGEIDELVALLGIIRADNRQWEARHAKERHDTPLPLSWCDMQQQLMLVMKHVAMASGKDAHTESQASWQEDGLQVPEQASWQEDELQVLAEAVQQMECFIDAHASQLPFTFVLPGSNRPSAFIHWARSKARTVERRLWAVAEQYRLSTVILCYANRLSDYLFVVATQKA